MNNLRYNYGRCLLVVLMAMGSHACIFASIVDGIEINRKELPEFGVSLTYPAHWEVHRGDFFHFTAHGSVDGHQGLMIEYRGLPKRLKGRQARTEYASGWYQAFIRSYKKLNWKFISQQHDIVEDGDTFRFVGQYEDPVQGKMLKLGVMRFRHNRLHAIYYTAPAKSFEDVLPIFVHLDKRHRYLPAE